MCSKLFAYVYEVCPFCEEEVKLKSVMKVQSCPSCGKLILPCSLCDSDVADCVNCQLEKERENLLHQ